jgi:hypothetical protein
VAGSAGVVASSGAVAPPDSKAAPSSPAAPSGAGPDAKDVPVLGAATAGGATLAAQRAQRSSAASAATQRPGFARPGGDGPRPTARPVGRARRQRSLVARLAPWLIALAALGVVVVGLLVLTGGNGQPTAASNAARREAAADRRARHAFRPADVTVSVLNGTQVNNLAHDTGQRLASYGYKEGNIATAANQTQQTTIVAYTRGHRQDALHVAKTLGLHPSAVAPVDPATLQVACPSTAPCSSDVIVTIGQDLANAPTATG